MRLCLLGIVWMWALISTVTAQPAQELPLQPVTLQLNWKYQFEYAGFIAARERGFYAEEGLNVTLREYEVGESIVDDVLAGRAEYGIWTSSLILERMRGRPVVMLANYYKNSPLVLISQPEIRNPSQLLGKRVMATLDDSSAEILLMLGRHGLTQSDVEWVPTTFDLQPLLNREVEAFTAYLSNQPFLLNQLGAAYSILDPVNYGIDFYGDSLFTSEEQAQRHPERVAAMVRASTRGWEYALEHPAEVIDLILERYNTQNKSREALAFEEKRTREMMLPEVLPLGSIDKSRVERIAEEYRQLGLSALPASLEGFIWESARAEANPKRVELTPEEQAFVRANPVVSVALLDDYAPFTYRENGQVIGLEHDLLRTLSEFTGLRFDKSVGAWSQNLAQFQNGEVDLITSISYRPEREAFTRFTDPYYEVPNVVYVRDDFGEYVGLESLNGRKIGIVEGVYYEEELRAALDAEIIEIREYSDLAKALVFGNIDAVIGDVPSISHQIRKSLFDNVRVVGEVSLPNMNVMDLRLGVRSDQPQLHSILQKGLASITPQERLQLVNLWLGVGGVSEASRQRVSLTQAEAAYLQRKERISMCALPDYKPFEYIDESAKHAGIVAEMMKLISQRVGVPFELVPTQTWQESLRGIQQRSCDLLPLAIHVEAHRAWMDFTQPYVVEPFVVATRLDELFIKDIQQLGQRPVGVIKDASYIDLLREEHPSIQVVEVQSAQDGLERVRGGELFGYIDAMPSLAYSLQEHEIVDLKIAGQLGLGFGLSAATRNDEPLLGAIMQKALDSISEAERKKILNSWVEVRVTEEIDYTLLWQLGGGFSVLLFGGFLWNRKLTRLNRTITQKNQDLEEAHQALKVANAEIHAAHTTLARKDELLTSSMEYASSIQRSMLPTEAQLRACFAEQFVLFQPCELVGGDTYFMRSTPEGCFFAVIDCTGHGVPGALMTMVAHDALEQVISSGLNDLAEILQQVDALVFQRVNQNRPKSVIHDGMELALLRVSPARQELEFCGAGLSMLVCDSVDVSTVRGRFQGLGDREQSQPFTAVRVPYATEKTYVLFTDGYVDQLGGPRRKTYGKRRFRELFQAQRSMPQQQRWLVHQFHKWRGDHAQIDDVTVIGFRLKGPPRAR